MNNHDQQMPQGQSPQGQMPSGQVPPAAPHHAYQAAYGYDPSQQQPSATAQQPQTSAVAQPHQHQAAPAAGAHAVPGEPVQTGTTAQHSAHTAPLPNQPGSAQVAAAQSKKSTGGKTFVLGFFGALLACALAFGIAIATGNFGSRPTLGAATSTSIEAVSEEASLAEAVASKCLPSVGSVMVYSNQAQTTGNGIYDLLYGYGYDQEDDTLTQSGMGSCVMLSDDGYAITNYHVVEGGSKYEVTIAGEVYDAELVGEDASSDVAVLKLDGSGFTPIELGDSDNITIGEWVMSIGSPFGLEQSVATGIVSATSRSQIMDSNTDMLGQSTGEVTIYPNMIQTDAAINPGNSGGALVDAQGKLIGVNTLITSYSGNYSGVGFAIPVNYAVQLAQDIIEGKEPTHAQLGVNLTTVNAGIAERYGFSVDEGAYVSAVSPDSGAEAAGIKVGDIIVGFDGETVSSASDLMLDVRTKNPGDKVTLQVDRDGEQMDVEVTLGQSSGTTASSSSSSSSDAQQQRPSAPNSSRNMR